MDARLRPAVAADAARVAELLIATRSAFMPYVPSVRGDAAIRDWVKSSLVPFGGVTVAEVQGQVVAAMAVEQSNVASWVRQLAVDPALIGHGIGSLLLEHALRTLALPIRLYTFQENLGARQFYERHGFLAIAFTDGQGNEERCPDVLYELRAPPSIGSATPPRDGETLPVPPESLSFGGVGVRFIRVWPGEPSRGFVPYYHFRIVNADGSDVGHLNFRVGDTEHVRICAGHLGFEISEEFRGHHYAREACRAIGPFIRLIYDAVTITCDPDNRASIRTIEQLGATFVDEVSVPARDPHYRRGSRSKRRYRWRP